MSEKAPFMVFSGTNSRYLAEKICASLNCPLGNMNITHFADGEFAVSYEESIRGSHVFLVQSTFPNSDNLMELLLMIDAAKRASAKSVIAVIPYFGWARQDRKDKPRVSIGAKLVADLLSVAGIDRLITMDLHADQIQGFFNIPVDHLYASAVFLPYIQSLHLEDLVIATPDVGGSKRASTFSKYLGVPLVLCNKSREKANEVASMQIIGDVKGKNVVVSGAGTIGNLIAQFCIARGAKNVLITDVSDLRLAKARECGIKHTLNITKKTLKEAAQELFGEEGYQVGFEVAGVEVSIRSLMETIEKGSDIVVVAVFAKNPALSMFYLGEHELRLIGSMMYRHEDYLTAIDYVSKGIVNLKPLVSNRFAFEEYDDAYKFIDTHRETSMKVLIDFEQKPGEKK